MMLFRIALFLLCLPALFATAGVECQNYRGEMPAWIKPCGFSLGEVPVKPSQVNSQCLLIDVQRNWEEKTKYAHFAFKVLSQWGAEQISKVEIEFAPSYENIVVHSARVFREGTWRDCLASADVKVVQKETRLDHGIFDGALTLIYFLDDVREGDIVEYSYSRIGEPILSASKLVGTIYLQYGTSVEKIFYRLLGNSDLPLQIKSFNTDIQPTVAEVSEGLCEWIWEVNETSASALEDNEPHWYDASARVELSLFSNWGEVAKHAAYLYALPEDFEKSIPGEMAALIEKWQRSAKSTSERALMAIRFVQDEVRYLALSEGAMGWQPNDPCFTFQRRFGDCKSKSFLLHALLKLLDIPSTLALVHAKVGKQVAERLPTPYFADHLVLQLEVDGKIYWVDSTINLQGGSLETNYFPNYEWALLLSDKTEGLTAIPQEVHENPTEIKSSYLLESEDSACLKVEETCYGSMADAVRRMLKGWGLKKIAEQHLANIQGVYGWVNVVAPMELVDDRENNVLCIRVAYHIPTEESSSGKLVQVHSYTLSDYLTGRINPMRASPYEINYPLWIREHIHVENPYMNREAIEEEYAQKNDLLSYALSCRAEGRTIDYEIELKHLQDHIPPRLFRDYWNLVNDILRNSPASVRIAPRAE